MKESFRSPTGAVQVECELEDGQTIIRVLRHGEVAKEYPGTDDIGVLGTTIEEAVEYASRLEIAEEESHHVRSSDF